MSGDQEHTLATFRRGERGEVRLTRCSYKGAVFTKLQLWFPGTDGALHPGRQVVTIRDGELDEVIQSLCRVRARTGSGARAQSESGKAKGNPDDGKTDGNLPSEDGKPDGSAGFDMAAEDGEGLF